MASRLFIPRHFLEDELLRLAQESEQGTVDINFCTDVALEALKSSSYTVRARSISLAVGFCTYAARLIESIGVKDHYIHNLPGKGVVIHKVLGILSPIVFEEYIKQGKPLRFGTLKDLVNKALILLNWLGDSSISHSDDVHNVIEIIQKFNIILNDLKNRSFIDSDMLDSCRAVVENYMIDFDLHIAGTPDLIIECLKPRPRAIVIEWKTQGTTPQEWEKVQVYTYALLVARRLGYGFRRGLTTGVDFENLISSIANERLDDVAVIPLIIRPSGAYSDHPAYPVSAVKPLRVSELKERLKKIIVAAAHLTLLRTDYVGIVGSNYEILKERCDIKIRDYRGSLLRWTPRILDARGSPKKRDGWPCKVCERIHPIIYDMCPYFFGSGPKKDVLDTILWDLRFNLYRIHERALAPIKALHDIPFEHLKQAVERGKTIIYDSRGRRYIFEERSPRPRPVIQCYHGPDRMPTEVRYDIFSDVSVKPLVLEEGEIPRMAIELRRRIRSHEMQWVVERGREDYIPRVWTPRRGKPVLVVFNDELSRRTALSLGITLFGRVGSVEVNPLPDGGGTVSITVEPISNAFKYQFLVMGNYANYTKHNRYYNEMFSDVIVAEVNVDLTHMELQALAALQRMIRAKAEELGLRDVKKVLEALRSNGSYIELLLTGTFTRTVLESSPETTGR
jgi:hypothetical protein